MPPLAKPFFPFVPLDPTLGIPMDAVCVLRTAKLPIDIIVRTKEIRRIERDVSRMLQKAIPTYIIGLLQSSCQLLHIGCLIQCTLGCKELPGMICQ